MIFSPEQTEELHAKLNDIGLAKVRQDFANSIYGPKNSAKSNCVEAWMTEQETQKADDVQARTEIRENKNIELAKEANAISNKALLMSKIAIGISIIGVLIATFST